MNFPEAEKYLYSLGNEVETMKLGLDNIRTLLNALGNPQNKYKKVQVAGTNGKGSVCVFLDSICVHAGIKTGLYTSPHLVSITERVKIDGVDISEEGFARLATRVRETSERLVHEGRLERVPTFFEQVTAIALVAFAESKVELAILETGLGGRFDATTAANAEIAAITRIDLDHQEFLGDTIEKIAAEKAAIIHSGSHVVVAPQKPSVRRVILRRCREVGVEPLLVEFSVKLTPKSGDYSYDAVFNSGTIRLVSQGEVFEDVTLGIWGNHQWANAAASIDTARELAKFGWRVSSSQIVQGLSNARHPGRLEFEDRFLLDGAHNPGGAYALAQYLEEYVHQPITLVFGAMRDKSVGEILSILAPKAEIIVLTKPDNSRAMEPSEIVNLLPADFDMERVRITDSVKDALTLAPWHCLSGVILVTGSLYLVGEAKRILKDEHAV